MSSQTKLGVTLLYTMCTIYHILQITRQLLPAWLSANSILIVFTLFRFLHYAIISKIFIYLKELERDLTIFLKYTFD